MKSLLPLLLALLIAPTPTNSLRTQRRVPSTDCRTRLTHQRDAWYSLARRARDNVTPLPAIRREHDVLVIGDDKALAACVAEQGAADSLPGIPGPIVTGLIGKVVAGDTLVYTISWGPGARATSYHYRLTVTGTNGAWTAVADSNAVVGTFPGTALPDDHFVTATVLKTWLSAIPWDSATFTVSVNSVNSAGSSAAVSTSWKVTRKPGPPSPPVIDSSQTVTGLLVQPPTVTVVVGARRQVCAFPQFLNGAVAERTQDRAACDTIYARTVPFATASRVSVAGQAKADSLCITWRSSNPTVTTVTSELCPLGWGRPELHFRAEAHVVVTPFYLMSLR